MGVLNEFDTNLHIQAGGPTWPTLACDVERYCGR